MKSPTVYHIEHKTLSTSLGWACRVAFLIAACPFAGISHALEITVVNPDFEIVATTAADNGNPIITSGWVTSNPALTYFNPDDGDFDGATDGDATPTTLPDGGTYVAFLYNGSTITQLLSTPVVGAGSYTLSYTAMKSGQFAYGNYTVALKTTNGDTIISKTQADHTIPASKGFVPVEFTGTAPLSATGNLVIQFTSTSTGLNLPFFDNVGLSVDSGPDPVELRINSISLSGSTLTVEMEGQDGADYWCASSTDLNNFTTAEETSLGSPFQTAGGTATFTIDTGNRTSLFVRIQNFDPEPATAATARVFLLGGQSNMAGVGTNSQLAPPYDAPQTDVKFWGGAFGTSNWVDLAPGFGNTASQFGPEVSFGRALKDAYPDDDLYLIKYAVSGTALYNDWAPPSGPQYTSFVNTVAAALANLDTAGVDYQIAGMLWMQGESDAAEGQGAAYETNLRNFIADMRTRFGEPDLPFLIGRITTFYGDATNNTAVRNAQVTIASDTPNVHWFDTDAFSPGSPGSPAGHYNTAGQIQLGQGFAASLPSSASLGSAEPAEAPLSKVP